MDLLKAYRKDSRQQKDSRQYVVDCRQGKDKPFLSKVYSLPSTKKNSLSTVYSLLSTDRGVALIVALLMSVAIMALAAGVLYFISQSTTMSGAGKRYATAQEAADGAVEVVKDTVNLVMWGESAANIFDSDENGATDANCGTGSTATSISAAILNENQSCATYLNLPSTISGQGYRAEVTLLRLYSVTLPGGRLEFARSTGGVSSTAIFYRITSTIVGPNNERAENSALYRFAG